MVRKVGFVGGFKVKVTDGGMIRGETRWEGRGSLKRNWRHRGSVGVCETGTRGSVGKLGGRVGTRAVGDGDGCGFLLVGATFTTPLVNISCGFLSGVFLTGESHWSSLANRWTVQ